MHPNSFQFKKKSADIKLLVLVFSIIIIFPIIFKPKIFEAQYKVDSHAPNFCASHTQNASKRRDSIAVFLNIMNIQKSLHFLTTATTITK